MLNAMWPVPSDAGYQCQNIDISDTGITATGIDTWN